MVRGKYTWHMSRMLCDSSHDKLRNLSYRVKANLQLRLLTKKGKIKAGVIQKYYKKNCNQIR